MNPVLGHLSAWLCTDIDALRPLLYRIAYSWCHDPALADDLVQETLSKAWLRRVQLREAKARKSWAVAILHRCWLDQLRSSRVFEDIEDWQDELVSAADSPETCCNREQVIACVRAAVARLPLGQRQVLTLIDLENFSYAEVATILDVPVGTVMSRLSRARAALKTLLAPAGLHTQQTPAPPRLRRVK